MGHLRRAPGEASGYLLTLKPSTIAAIQEQTMSQSEETIRRRIDALGLTEPFVAPYGQGDNEIIVELPGEGDPNRAKSVIQAGGQLELRRVEDATSLSFRSRGAGRARRRAAAGDGTRARRRTTDASGQAERLHRGPLCRSSRGATCAAPRPCPAPTIPAPTR